MRCAWAALGYQGVVVQESYYANNSASRYESDSLAKTATALVVGAAVYAGLFTLDTPLSEYGVPPVCDDGSQTCWKMANCTGVVDCPKGDLGFYSTVTARHILAQSSGCVTGKGCYAAPGTAFTYDSEQYISHLSYLVGATAKQPAVQWATNNLMSKLGLENFYVDDGLGRDFSAGGKWRVAVYVSGLYQGCTASRVLHIRWGSASGVKGPFCSGGIGGYSAV